MDRSLWETRVRQGRDFDATAHQFGANGGIAAMLDPRYYVPTDPNAMYAPGWQLWYRDRTNAKRHRAAGPDAAATRALRQAARHRRRRRAGRDHEANPAMAADAFYVFGVSLPPDGYGIVRNNMHNVTKTMPTLRLADAGADAAGTVLQGIETSDWIGKMLDSTQHGATSLRTGDWFKTATRWTQITLAENDPAKFDPAFWIDVFHRTRSNATCISAGGYIAYYPSKVPLHYVSRFLGDKDFFGALVEGARKLNMHVMARVDPHAIHDDAADAHPEWVAVDTEGKPRRHWAYPEVWVANAYGDYNSVFMPEVVKEIVRTYDIDAIFANRWQGHGVDYSEDSRRRFRDFSGFDLPLKADAADPAWQAWLQWRRKVLTDVIVQWDDAVKAIRPHASFIPNMSGASLMEFDLSVIAKHCPFLVVDHQGRRGMELGWSAGRNGKRIRATFPDRPVVLITSIGPEEEYRWKDAGDLGRGNPALDQRRHRRMACAPGSPSSTAWCRTSAGSRRSRIRSPCRRPSSRCSSKMHPGGRNRDDRSFDHAPPLGAGNAP